MINKHVVSIQLQPANLSYLLEPHVLLFALSAFRKIKLQMALVTKLALILTLKKFNQWDERRR